ncbi:MAG: RNA--NAD 2'-phosphotransferase [Bacteroidetes bacterium QH_2_63_10]|nr:MAG: RNA--NAD 2'-phosphotransferase [Bacteroidetes bacterium QH_2_63_10]
MRDRLVETSKFLSYVLRHNPDALGLELDPGGWADVDVLLKRARADGRSIDRDLLAQMIDHGEKERFTFSEDGTKIRANYGHSIDVNLDLTPTPPPQHLYHGTARQTLSAIQHEGLRPQSRQYVHLSSTREEAIRVGRRHGTPVVLTVDAQGLDEAGHALYRSTDAVWLTHRVPPQFLQTPSDE